MATEDTVVSGGGGADGGDSLKAAASRGVEALKARVAAKRAAEQGGAPGNGAGADTGGGGVVLPADAGLGEDEITDAAKDELRRLASIRAAEDGADTGLVAEGVEGESGPDPETSDGSGDAEQSVMEGLAGESLYDRRQREIAEAKARPGGKAKGKAAAAKGKAAAKAKSDKQKEKEAERKARDKAKAEERKAAEKKRKEALAAKKKEAAAARAARKVPDIVKRFNKAEQEAFSADYAMAGPKTDKNPQGLGIRRAKADRGDFAAGYVMAMRRIRADLKRQGTAA